MENIREIKIDKAGRFLKTSGLRYFIGYEIEISLKNKEEYEYSKVLKYLIDYFIDYKPVIEHTQTIAYYSWLLEFFVSQDHIKIYEVNSTGDEFDEGVDKAIENVNQQKQLCDNFNVATLFPLFSQKIVISDGVLDGIDVDAVRYPSPDHMTGWWITTDLYDGNVDSLKTLYYFDVIFKRPDLIKYFALPFGFRFFSGPVEDIWFDEDVINSKEG